MFFKEKELCRELGVLLDNKRYDEVISKIRTVYDGKEIPPSVEKKLALAYFYKNDFDNSLSVFTSVLNKEENTENLFNVMTTLLSLKQIERATEVFDKIIDTHKGAKSTGKGKDFLPQLCIPYIRFYYANGLADAELYDQALVQLDELKKVYIRLKITDCTLLYLRGVPGFGSFIQLCKRTFVGLKKDFENSEFLNELIKAVDEEGKEIINNILKTN